MKYFLAALLVCLVVVCCGGELAQTDDSLQELKRRAIPLLRQQFYSKDNIGYLMQVLAAPGQVPDELDWRQASQPQRVGPVRHQSTCGSCWAFSAAGALEGLLAKETGHFVELSVQELVDCSRSNLACAGGLISFAFDDLNRIGGIMTSADYPYTSSRGHCKFNPSQVAPVTSLGSVVLPEGDEIVLKEVLAKFGPVSVMIEASDMLYSYRGGILADPNCSSTVLAINHAVLLVGYGTDPKHGDYWLLKNSWGTGWGEKGYFRMKRGVNMCGIGAYSSIPKFRQSSQ